MEEARIIAYAGHVCKREPDIGILYHGRQCIIERGSMHCGRRPIGRDPDAESDDKDTHRGTDGDEELEAVIHHGSQIFVFSLEDVSRSERWLGEDFVGEGPVNAK